MTKTICVFNQKGGVGKTTTVVNLAAALGKLNKKVLVIDIDPQGNATSGLGIDKYNLEETVYDFILNEAEADKVIRKSSADNVDIIPATPDLAGLEVELVGVEDRQFLLKTRINNIEDYDFIFLDSPPSLGQLSINALVAADSVIIPIQTEFYALEGVSQLMESYKLIVDNLNPNLAIEGIVLSMFDGRNNLSIEVVEEVKKYFKDKVFKSIIPRNIKVAEAPSFGVSVIDHDPNSKGAISYKKLAKEIIKQNE